MRSPSGAGKTNLAKELGVGGVVYSTDDFWMTPTGEYKFDASKLGQAHTWNFNRTEEAMLDGISPIVIDNTNITRKEMIPYAKLAKKYNYEIELKEPNWHPELRTPEGKWNIEFIKKLQEERKNKTGKSIPPEVVERMINNYQYNLTPEDLLKSENPQ